jgi:endonuclease/exonuclease/phosphatase family metal-dependent hydrolase
MYENYSKAEEIKVIRGKYAASAAATDDLKVLNWNLERGIRLSAITEFIHREKPVLCIFQEVDLNTKRVRGRNLSDVLGSTLMMDYIWAAEFEELGQKFSGGRAYQGQAIMTYLPIRTWSVLRFGRQSTAWAPRWFIPNWSMFQRRLGGRIALIVEFESDGLRLIVYNIHLESRGPERLRRQQLEETLADVERYAKEDAIIIAGDFNCRESPAEVSERLRQAGFRDAVGQGLSPTSRRGHRLDWIFVRGDLQSANGRIHHDIHTSDHFPVSVRLSRSAGKQGALP